MHSPINQGGAERGREDGVFIRTVIHSCWGTAFTVHLTLLRSVRCTHTHTILPWFLYQCLSKSVISLILFMTNKEMPHVTTIPTVVMVLVIGPFSLTCVCGQSWYGSVWPSLAETRGDPSKGVYLTDGWRGEVIKATVKLWINMFHFFVHHFCFLRVKEEQYNISFLLFSAAHLISH